ncbi:type II toxin-antitoxin system RelE/ParE family toxin [bacterium]|nr:MAG: type II toxin-antitoxin system RelE/ParE family toxin [bacterium]
MLKIVQTPTFSRQVKKLHKNQKKDLDVAVSTILANPLVGEMKKGDLDGLQVYKFRMVNQLMLLAYEFYENEVRLLLVALGSHENFYRDLKK